MSTEAIGVYSRDTVYGQLTAPFVYEDKGFHAVHINSHTTLDEPQEQKATTLNDFRQNIVKDKLFHIEDVAVAETLGMQTDAVENDILKSNVGTEFPPDTINNFTASSLSKSDIVNNAIQKGYSPNQAVTIAKAQIAYSKSLANPTSNVVESLSSHTVTGNKLASTSTAMFGNTALQQYGTYVNS